MNTTLQGTAEERREAINHLLDHVEAWLIDVGDLELYEAYLRVCRMLGRDPKLRSAARQPARARSPKPPPAQTETPQPWSKEMWLEYLRDLRAHEHLFPDYYSVIEGALCRIEKEFGGEFADVMRATFGGPVPGARISEELTTDGTDEEDHAKTQRRKGDEEQEAKDAAH